jgi:hypothetical protein
VAEAAQSIRADAERQVATVLRVECEPYVTGGPGTYACLAVTGDVPATARSGPASAGRPYRVRIDFASGRYAYCRVSPRAVKLLRAEVALSPECAGGDRPQNVQGQPG